MQHKKLIELRETYITSKEKVVSVEEASPEEFHEFIIQYMDVIHVDCSVWPLMMRWKAINYAIDQNIPLRFVDKAGVIPEDCEGGKHVPNTEPNNVHEDINPIEKEEDVRSREEDVSRVPSGGA